MSAVTDRIETPVTPTKEGSAPPRFWLTLAGWIIASALNGGYLVYAALVFAGLGPWR